MQFYSRKDTETVLNTLIRELHRVRERRMNAEIAFVLFIFIESNAGGQAVRQCVQSLCIMFEHLQPDSLMSSVNDYHTSADRYVKQNNVEDTNVDLHSMFVFIY
jgi:hypothetical protein